VAGVAKAASGAEEQFLVMGRVSANQAAYQLWWPRKLNFFVAWIDTCNGKKLMSHDTNAWYLRYRVTRFPKILIFYNRKYQVSILIK